MCFVESRWRRTAGDSGSEHLDGHVKVTFGLGGRRGLVVNRLQLQTHTGLLLGGNFTCRLTTTSPAHLHAGHTHAITRGHNDVIILRYLCWKQRNKGNQ